MICDRIGVLEILTRKHDSLLTRYDIDFRVVKERIDICYYPQICVRDVSKKRDVACEYTSLLTNNKWGKHDFQNTYRHPSRFKHFTGY